MCSQFCSHVMEIGSVRFWFRRGDISIACKDGSSPSCETILIAFNKCKGELVPHVFDNVAKATVAIDTFPVIQKVIVPSPSAGAVQVMSHIRSDAAAEAEVCVNDSRSPCQLSPPVPPSSPLETLIENPAEYCPPAAGPPMMWSWNS